MGRLLVTAICSVDGYVADSDGSFEFAFPTAEVHQAVNDLERGVGTQLLGRRSYEVMTYWETAPTEGDEAPVELRIKGRAPIRQKIEPVSSTGQFRVDGWKADADVP